jgi:hypothetical protein
MGLISRQATAPIADGEIASGVEVENELTTIFNVVNGNLNTDNLSASAGIVSGQIADGAVTNAKIANNAVTTAKMIAAAVPKGSITTDATGDTLTTSGTIADVPSISSITLTPGSTSDLIVCDFTAVIDSTSSTADIYEWAFSIGGVDTSTLGITYKIDSADIITTNITFAKVSGTVSAVEVKPRYNKVSGSGSAVFDTSVVGLNKILRVFILPIK